MLDSYDKIVILISSAYNKIFYVKNIYCNTHLMLGLQSWK